MTDKRIVLSTAGSEQEAHKIAHILVERRLAACVNILPQVRSIYRWKDEIESAQEWLLLIKTRADKFPAVRDAIGELHSYEVPECIVVEIEDGSLPYLQWLEKATQKKGQLPALGRGMVTILGRIPASQVQTPIIQRKRRVILPCRF